jgi:hypothetical protein
VLVKRCSGQPGLCHNGQFEPNLATPALAYANLVNRPSIELERQLRVAPGDPDDSVLIKKLRGVDVATRMPLGAEPLSDAEMAMFEDWIRDGALRRPAADPAPILNNPPQVPEIGVFAGGERLDGAGSFRVTPGTALTFRISVRDFETDDADIPFALFVLNTADGREAILRPGVPMDPQLGLASYDAAGPMGNGDQLNWRFDFTIGETIGLRNQAGAIAQVDTSGLTFNVIAAYLDGFPEGIASFAIRPGLLTVE